MSGRRYLAEPHESSAPQPPADDVAELEALIAAGGFWRLAPDWVPRGGYSMPTLAVLRVAENGLTRWLSDEQ
ncbi:hypothetical protein AQI95_34405 [Streptomyces yokosukanensis]|uniref:Uncharacterized protein n=1 Tax=Streptomyces yokosukanensis TaxID=67386 RepID=A0A101NWG8_9ACTN|nr:hypothetical protein AQI95_34405 [Streptomyces yokosukanensis]